MEQITLGQKTVFKVVIGDNEYEMKKPTAKEVAKLHKSSKDKKDDLETLEALIDFFEGLGLPRKVTEDLEVDQILLLSEKIGGSKKK